jgi:hypothetical protein
MFHSDSIKSEQEEAGTENLLNFNRKEEARDKIESQ